MNRRLSRPAPTAASSAVLAARGTEALQLGRFKDAVEAFKLLLRQDPQPQWRQALAQAYTGRARDLAAKGMFKEATIVLENTRTTDGLLAAPLLYLVCLTRQGQHQRAAEEARRYLDRDPALLAGTERLGELAAGLLLVVAVRVTAAPAAPPPAGSWAALVQHAATALHAWSERQPAEAVEQRLAALPLRSVFRPVRLMLKALITGEENAGRAAGLLDMVPADGVFGPFAVAAKTALTADPEAMLANWSQLSAAQQTFIAEARGTPAAASTLLNQILDAERRGAAALFALLIRQPASLPRSDLRAACLELLVQMPAQMPQFERTFGPLSEPEKHRVLALAAEVKQDWFAAEAHWRNLAESLGRQAGPEAKLARGVIYRHLADPALPFLRVPAGDSEDPQADYLEQSLAADPGHLPTSLRLIARYREAGRSKDWHRAVDQAMQAFPQDSTVLMQAVEAAVARKSYKKAAGFARTLLTLDPINRDVRRRMIELELAQARKQMRASRPDLAWKTLSEAATWERADAPEASLRLGQGLVGSHLGRAQAEALLREGVRLAGDGVVGWFRAALEAALMRIDAGDCAICGHELDRARQSPPSREAILAITRALGRESDESKRALAPLLGRMEGWLRSGAPLDWPAADFAEVADVLWRFGLFETLQAYVRHADQNASQDGVARFYAVVAATRGDGRQVSLDQEETLHDLAEQAAARQDFHAVNRIQRFLEGPDGKVGGRLGRPDDMLDAEDLQQLFDMALDGLPAMLPSKEIRAMLNDLGYAMTVDAVDQVLRDSPFGIVLPPPQIRQLAEAAVARVPTRGARSRR